MNLQNKQKFENVEILLASIVPQADEDFTLGLERRLAALYQQQIASKTPSRRQSLIPIFTRSHRPWAWSLAAIVISILVLSMLTIPSVSTFAQEALRYFNRAVNEIVNIGYIVREAERLAPIDKTDFEVASVEEASARAGIHVKAPTYLPDGFSLNSIMARKGNPAVGLIYKKPEFPVGFLIIQQYDPALVEMVTTCQVSYTTVVAGVDEAGTVIQQGEPIDEALAESDTCEELADVGADAEIVLVQIGEITGEYVAGGWVIDTQDKPLSNTQSGETVTYEHGWDPDYPGHRLRWEDKGIAYDIKAMGKGLTMDDIVRIAESMK